MLCGCVMQHHNKLTIVRITSMQRQQGANNGEEDAAVSTSLLLHASCKPMCVSISVYDYLCG